jgi:hypothetical protein
MLTPPGRTGMSRGCSPGRAISSPALRIRIGRAGLLSRPTVRTPVFAPPAILPTAHRLLCTNPAPAPVPSSPHPRLGVFIRADIRLLRFSDMPRWIALKLMARQPELPPAWHERLTYRPQRCGRRMCKGERMPTWPEAAGSWLSQTMCRKDGKGIKTSDPGAPSREE